jgi:hypothetical protein
MKESSNSNMVKTRDKVGLKTGHKTEVWLPKGKNFQGLPVGNVHEPPSFARVAIICFQIGPCSGEGGSYGWLLRYWEKQGTLGSVGTKNALSRGDGFCTTVTFYAYTFAETRRDREDSCIAGAARTARSLGCT